MQELNVIHLIATRRGRIQLLFTRDIGIRLISFDTCERTYTPDNEDRPPAIRRGVDLLSPARDILSNSSLLLDELLAETCHVSDNQLVKFNRLTNVRYETIRERNDRERDDSKETAHLHHSLNGTS